MILIVRKVKNFFGQPYPLYYFMGFGGIFVFLGVFIFILLFTYFFEPFMVNRAEHRMSYFWICLIHSGLVTAIALLYFFLLGTILKAYDQWTVGKEFLHLSIVFLLIGIGNFLIRDVIYDNPNNWSLGYLLEEIRNTFLVGSLIIVIFVPINYILMLRKNVSDSMDLKAVPNSGFHQDGTSKLAIKTQLNTDDFELSPENLLLARADGNYLELYVDNKSKIQKLVKRMTLKELEVQLAHFHFIQKTHRAYLVNLQKVHSTKGNAQGYQLRVNGIDEFVPVSRSMLAGFKERLNAG